LSEAHSLLASPNDRKGLRDLAQQSFETALHAPDDQAMHLNNLGYLFYKNGEYDEAIKYLKRSVKINSEDKRIWNNLGMAQCGPASLATVTRALRMRRMSFRPG